MGGFKRFFVVALLVVFSLSCMLFTGAWVRSFFMPVRFRWMEGFPKPTIAVRDLVVFSSRGGLGFYFSHTTFPSPRSVPGDVSWSHDKRHISTSYPNDQDSPGSGFFGFHFAHHVRGKVTMSEGGEFPQEIVLSLASSEYVVIFPYPAVIVLLLLPIPFLWRIRRKQKRFARGLCQVCGYDLRASPVRCPECGNVVSSGEGRG